MVRPSLSRSARSVARYVAGWRTIALLSVVAAAFIVGLVGGGTVTAGLLAALIALLVLAGVVPLIALEAQRIASWSDRQSEIASLATDTRHRLSLIEPQLQVVGAVTAGATRFWADPTTLPWPNDDPSRPVLLLPGAAYHLAEIIALAAELEKRDIPVRIAVGEAHWARVRQGLVAYTGVVYALPSPETVALSVSALVAMKDWAGYRPYVEAARARGIPTFAKVEGAQDFDEVDTRNNFRPYRTADHIFCQGANDFKALPGDRHIVGSTRLERLWMAPFQPPRRKLAVVNLNFTYGVLTEARDHFLETARRACAVAGMPHVVAVHPAVIAPRTDPPFTTIPISRLLENGSLLISRFSTVPFEAMARGVPFVYHNPHGEQVPTFENPDGAFRVTRSVDELAAAIEEARDWTGNYRERSHSFFAAQVDMDEDRRSEQRAADVIESLLTG
jgi:hypothetical protein